MREPPDNAHVGRREIFHLVLITPTKYDEDGYPLVWWRSVLPSNSLAALNGLGRDCQERQVLGRHVEIRLTAIDEANRLIRTTQILKQVAGDGGRALIALVGVQSNQFPRAVDLARPFLEAGLPVCLGGFHVSGCFAMLPEVPPEIQAALDEGISLFLGEAEEGRLDQVLLDAYARRLQPIYNYLGKLPSIAGAPIPILDETDVKRTMGWISSFDVGRGCPYKCSFCTIINVHGRKSRFRTAEDLERIVVENDAQGIRQFFVTDDNLARNQNWSELFDTLIRLREERGIKLELSVQVDTRCHQIPGFIPKAAAAGVNTVFIGLENINPDNLATTGKSQNRITDYREMLLAWKQFPVTICAGYIVGLPFDTKESLMRDVEIIKRELAIDHIFFTMLTPLPGSADHARIYQSGEWMDPDLTRYNTNFRVIHHPRMTDREWDQAYREMWRRYYSWDHMARMLRRAHALRGDIRKTRNYLGWYHHFPINLGLHPLEGGLVQLRSRVDRRPTRPREHPLVFYPKYFFREMRVMLTFWLIVQRMRRIDRRIERDPSRFDYRDEAITPPSEQDFADLALFRDTRGGRDAVAKAAARKAAAPKRRIA